MTKGNILITGVSTGIGRASAKKFISEGYVVYGSVRKAEDGAAVAAELGENFHPLLFDVTDHKAINEAAATLNEQLGNEGLRLLVNNAGIALSGPLDMLDVDEYRRNFEVNFFGLIAVTKAFLPLLGAQENCPFAPGKIINMSSIVSKRSMPFMTPYSSSKAAVDSFTEGLRREMFIFGIDVVAINPGPVSTPIWDKIDYDRIDSHETLHKETLKRFITLVDRESHQSIEVEDLAQLIFRTFRAKSPRTTHVVMKQKFLKYTLPKIFPERVIDWGIRKALKI